MLSSFIFTYPYIQCKKKCFFTGWLDNSLKQFQTDLLESVLLKEAANSAARAGAGNGAATITQPLQQHAPLSRAGQQATSNKSSLPNVKNNGGGNGSDSSDMADILVTQFRKCLTTNLVVRLNNFTLWKVSTSKVKSAAKEFLSGKQFLFFSFCFRLITKYFGLNFFL